MCVVCASARSPYRYDTHANVLLFVCSECSNLWVCHISRHRRRCDRRQCCCFILFLCHPMSSNRNNNSLKRFSFRFHAFNGNEKRKYFIFHKSHSCCWPIPCQVLSFARSTCFFSVHMDLASIMFCCRWEWRSLIVADDDDRIAIKHLPVICNEQTFCIA